MTYANMVVIFGINFITYILIPFFVGFLNFILLSIYFMCNSSDNQEGLYFVPQLLY